VKPEAPPARRRRWWKVPLGVALAAVAYVAGANLYLIARARAETVADVAAAPPRPYAIVLGNRVFADGSPSRELAARLETALALVQTGRAGSVIVSGRAAADYDEPHAMADWLAARGVPRAQIVVDVTGHRTAATMAAAAARGVRAAHVVTQGYHLPRALYLARRAGIDALGVPAPVRRAAGWESFRVLFRESAARAEIVLEVAVRGVR
jgi:vancomycin permeability regulator SanA